MAETSAKAREERFVHAVARAGLYTSIAGAVIMALVLLGNLYIIPFKHTPAPWLRLIVFGGPVLSGLLGFASTGSTWYGRWRIVRRKERYDIRDDLLDQALNAPDDLQNLPNQLGCSSVGGPTILVASVILCLFTFAPAPLGIIGSGINGTNIAVATTTTSTTTTATTVIATPKPTAKPDGHHPQATPTASAVSPTATPIVPTPTTAPTATPIPPTATPTPTPHVDVRLVPTSMSATCYSPYSAPTVRLTVDNTRSNIAVGWKLTFAPAPGTGFTNPWGSGAPDLGSVAAGKTVTIMLTPKGANCYNASYAGTPFVADVTLTSGGTGSLAFTLTLFHSPPT